ncbi:hypothetical protein C2S52_015663 [Perilla frutescens var. hirtella]|nr:hypothetical protein C2S52_015663 [Perilla frutescens var. hirtella]KAH6815526.1 hypothetical protein C2S51_020346 [Perilla frutescens var. frutescens]
MASPSVDRKGGESSGEDMPRQVPTPFLTKTYQLVDDHAIDDIISWNVDGSAFVVWNPPEFARDLLPKYFKHNNFSSFVRQLNTYGFRKVVPDRWEFSNDCFRRGEKQLLRDIQRRKMVATPNNQTPAVSAEEQVISSSNFSGSTAELIGENERLRKQNVQLNKELRHMKNMCNSICVLMSNYAGSKDNDRNGAGCQEHMHACKLYMAEKAKALNLLPVTRYCEEMAAAHGGGGEGNSNNMRLFGVPIGAKRWRESEGASAEHEMDSELGLPGREIKYEPLDDEELV